MASSFPDRTCQNHRMGPAEEKSSQLRQVTTLGADALVPGEKQQARARSRKMKSASTILYFQQ